MPPLSSDPETHQFSAGMCIRLCYVQITAQITVIWSGPITRYVHPALLRPDHSADHRDLVGAYHPVGR